MTQMSQSKRQSVEAVMGSDKPILIERQFCEVADLGFSCDICGCDLPRGCHVVVDTLLRTSQVVSAINREGQFQEDAPDRYWGVAAVEPSRTLCLNCAGDVPEPGLEEFADEVEHAYYAECDKVDDLKKKLEVAQDGRLRAEDSASKVISRVDRENEKLVSEINRLEEENETLRAKLEAKG